MSGSPPQQPAIRVSMWLLGLCATAAFAALLLNFGVSMWCGIQDSLSLPRPGLQRAATWAFWIWILTGFPAVLLYSWGRRSILVALLTCAFVVAVPAGLIFYEFGRAHQDVIAVMEVDGVGYGVLQTAAVLAPDTYVEIVRVEERSLLAEHFERLSPTNMRDFGPVTPSEVVKRGELWSASYDDDYGFIVQMANGWVVAGLGSDAVEVGYDTTSNRAASAAQLEEKFGLRSP